MRAIATLETGAARNWCGSVLFFVTVCTAAPLCGAAEPVATPLSWSRRAADSLLERNTRDLMYREGGKAKWNYQSGCVLLALLRLHEATGDARYLTVVRSSIDSFVGADGQIATYDLPSYNLDNINSGKAVLELARRTGEKRYEQACAQLRLQLRDQPRTTEGGFWHKRRYPSQMWLDGVYMASPFLAGYGVSFHDPAALDVVTTQIRLADAHLREATTGLYYHGWDESRKQIWANKETGRSACFWSRGIGWYGMALIDVLRELPAAHAARPQLEASLRQLCTALLRYQDEKSGVWFQVTDQGNRKGNYLEETGSAMFVYVLASAAQHGVLDRNAVPAVQRAYAGLLRKFVRVSADGRLDIIGCCRGAGLSEDRPGTFDYYIGEPVVSNDPKGIAPFILAGIAVQQLNEDKNSSR